MSFLKTVLPPVIFEGLLDIYVYLRTFRFRPLIRSNRQLGRRTGDVFIVGSGKSILDVELSKLKDKNVIFLNNLFEHSSYDEISRGRGSKFHLIAPLHRPQTDEQWKIWLEKLFARRGNKTNLLVGLSSAQPDSIRLIKELGFTKQHSLYFYLAGSKKLTPARVDKSFKVCRHSVVSAGAASVYAIFYAIFLGFERVYLVGMDHDYILYSNDDEMRFYKGAEHQKGEFVKTFGKNFTTAELLRQYEIFSIYDAVESRFPGRVINLSDRGFLRSFVRMKFNDLFESNSS